MLNKRQLGQYYEDKVCDILCSQGLKLIARNRASKIGEIDLIMQDKNCLVFVEVRYRKNDIYGDAQSTVNNTKQNKIIQAAYYWMNKQKIDIEASEFRFDVFAITGDNYQWIKNVFSY